MTSDQIESFLDTEFEPMDLGRTTPRKYFSKLLLTLWEEKGGFSGKRPFGSSGWDFDLYLPLVKGGFVNGSLDEDGRIECVDHKQADACVRKAISHIFYPR